MADCPNCASLRIEVWTQRKRVGRLRELLSVLLRRLGEVCGG